MNKTIQKPDGSTYHLTAHAEYRVLGNVPTWCIVYTVNGKADVKLLPALRRLAGHYAHTRREAEDWGIYYAKCAVERVEHDKLVRHPQNAHQRLVALCDKLKYDHVLQKMVHAVYPSSFLMRVKIECEATDKPALMDAIGHLIDGFTVDWKTPERSRFTGTFESTAQEQVA